MSDSCNPMDWNPPGFSIHGIFQARILEWIAVAFSMGSFGPRDQTRVFRIDRHVLYHRATSKTLYTYLYLYLYICIYICVCICVFRPVPTSLSSTASNSSDESRCPGSPWSQGRGISLPLSRAVLAVVILVFDCL